MQHNGNHQGFPMFMIASTHVSARVISSYQSTHHFAVLAQFPDSKVYGANMGPTWGRQDPGWPDVGPMNLAIRDFQTEA